MEKIIVAFDFDYSQHHYDDSFLIEPNVCIAFENDQIFMCSVRKVTEGIYKRDSNTKAALLGDDLRKDLDRAVYVEGIVKNLDKLTMREYIKLIHFHNKSDADLMLTKI